MAICSLNGGYKAMTDPNELSAKLERMRAAYQQLHSGSGALLEIGAIYWTERLLLRLVHALYGRRLAQIGGVWPDD